MRMVALLALVFMVGKESLAQNAELTRLGKAAISLLEQHCGECHGKGMKIRGGLNLFEKDVLRKKGLVNFTDAGASELIARVLPDGGMPPKGQGTALESGEIEVLKAWIAHGTPDEAGRVAAPTNAQPTGNLEYQDESAADEPLFGAKVLGVVYQDLLRRDQASLAETRYLSLAHMLLQDTPEATLDVYRNGLRKFFNSVTWNRSPVKLVPIDKRKTIFRVSLRDLAWTVAKWNAIADKDPFKVDYGGALAAHVARLVPDSRGIVLRGDWFVAVASAAPVYYDLLDLPKTAYDLERLIGVSSRDNITQGRVARAAMRVSKVSKNYRMIERHGATYGAYWRSYDFDGNSGKKDLFTLPLTGKDNGTRKFEHAGGEVIFHLPNGLQAYWLEKQDGTRLDIAPTEIVSDPSRRDPRIINGISCMGCHEPGLHVKFDDLLPRLARDPTAFGEDVDILRKTYKKREEMAAIFKADNDVYAGALKAAGVTEEPGRESVRALVDSFEANVTVESAAAELGITVNRFKELAKKDKRLDNVLFELEGSGLPRDRFIEVFPDLVSGALFARRSGPGFFGRSYSLTLSRSARVPYQQPLPPFKTEKLTPIGGWTLGEIPTTPAVLSDGEMVVVGSYPKLWWLSPKKVVHEMVTKGPVNTAPLVLGDGETVLAMEGGDALWARAGTQLHKLRVAGSACGAPTLLEDGETAVVECGDYKMYWLRDGKKVFVADIPSSILQAPGLLGDGRTVVSSGGNEIVWLRDGKRLQTFKLRSDASSSPVAVLGDGRTVFVLNNQGKALWLQDGKVIGETVHDCVSFSAPAVLGDGETVVVALRSGDVQWLKTGQLVYTASLPKGDSVPPVVLPDGQTVLVGKGKTLTMLREGKVLKDLDLDFPIATPPIVLRDGKTIVFGTEKRTLFWFRLE